jgi:hypothetical protein
MNRIEGCNIKIRTLIEMFKQFKQNPNKIFVLSDFGRSHKELFRERYLDTLIKLGLIEEVKTVYYCNSNKRRDVRGYRLLR